jgi:hypothetical protein
MQPEPVTIETADRWVILLRFFLPSLIGIAVMLLVYVAYHWKVAADRREIEDLNPERMRLRMEALAAEKKAARMSSATPDKPPPAETKTSEGSTGDGLGAPPAIG